jgi:hypothetical protein
MQVIANELRQACDSLIFKWDGDPIGGMFILKGLFLCSSVYFFVFMSQFCSVGFLLSSYPPSSSLLFTQPLFYPVPPLLMILQQPQHPSRSTWTLTMSTSSTFTKRPKLRAGKLKASLPVPSYAILFIPPSGSPAITHAHTPLSVSISIPSSRRFSTATFLNNPDSSSFSDNFWKCESFFTSCTLGSFFFFLWHAIPFFDTHEAN